MLTYLNHHAVAAFGTLLKWQNLFLQPVCLFVCFFLNRKALYKLYKKHWLNFAKDCPRYYGKGVYQEDTGPQLCANAPPDPLGQCLFSTTSPGKSFFAISYLFVYKMFFIHLFNFFWQCLLSTTSPEKYFFVILFFISINFLLTMSPLDEFP